MPCLNEWDVQSRHVHTVDGPFMTLYAGAGGGRGYVIFKRPDPDTPCARETDRRTMLPAKPPERSTACTTR